MGEVAQGLVDRAQVVDTLDSVGLGLRAGNSKLARIPMMAITTSSSISVNARALFMIPFLKARTLYHKLLQFEITNISRSSPQ